MSHHLACGEIFGGVRNFDEEVKSCCVRVALFSHSAAGEKGGDLYFLTHCVHDRITRVAIGDVQGHGTQVADISALFLEAMRHHINEIDNGFLMAELNEQAYRHGLRGLTTALICSFDRVAGCLNFVRAGHPPALLRKGSGPWEFMTEDSGNHLLLGVRPDVPYTGSQLNVAAGDSIFLYTDGLLEFPVGPGQLGEHGLLGLLQESNVHELIKTSILQRLAQFPMGFGHDDVTFMAVQFEQ